MSTLTKQQAQAILKDMSNAIDAVCRHHKLKRVKTHLTYGQMLDLKVSLQMEGGPSKEETTYNRWQRSLDLPKLGDTIKLKQLGEVTTAGLLVGGPYKSVIIKNAAGHRYKLRLNEFYSHRLPE